MGEGKKGKKDKVLMSEDRTLQAKERTVLAFRRTGLAFIGAGVVLINVFRTDIPTQFIGWGLIAIGAWEVFTSYRKLKKYKERADKIREKEKDRGLKV